MIEMKSEFAIQKYLTGFADIAMSGLLTKFLAKLGNGMK